MKVKVGVSNNHIHLSKEDFKDLFGESEINCIKELSQEGEFVSDLKLDIKKMKEYEIPIGDSYKLNARRKLGSGAFGDIYLGKNMKTNEEVAIKLESTKSKHPQLFYESKLYMSLQGGSKHFHITKFRWNSKPTLVWKSRKL